MIFMCWTRETGVIPAELADLARHESAGRAHDCVGYPHRRSHDNLDTGAHEKMAGRPAGSVGGKAKASIVLTMRQCLDTRQMLMDEFVPSLI